MARNHQNMGGVYANMDFPPYSYQEYPKHLVTGPHGKYIVVNNIEEEQKIKATLQQAEDSAPAKVEPYVADPEKEILISRARELGVPFNTKWSKAKLTETVTQAELDVDNLPPEDLTPKKIAKITPDHEIDDVTDEKQLKDDLIEKAKSLGIKANHLWGIPRLKASIAEVESK